MTSTVAPPLRLGIVAGGGQLPDQLIAACTALGRDYFVIALEGHAGAFDPAVPHIRLPLGRMGAALDRLRAEGVSDIVLAGAVRRPSWTELRPDAFTAGFLVRLGWKSLGDDGLLRNIAALLDEQGFRVVAVQDLLSQILLPQGTLGQVAPDADALADIARGMAVAADLGRLDIGQAVVVQDGLILGVEAAEGTDALIARCGTLKRQGPGPVLVKIAKPGQDRRLDLPTLGPGTVAAAAAAGFRGIAGEAGQCLLLDRPQCVSLADAAGMFLIGMTVDTP